MRGLQRLRRRKPLWLSTVIIALRGEGGSPTEGPIGRAIVMLAVPMVLEMCMESVFALVDIIFVSRLGATAVAAVGLTEAMFTLVYTVAMGLSIGVTAIVARRVGEGDRSAAADTTFQAMLLGGSVALVIALIGVWQTERLLGLMGADDVVIATGSGYARVMLGSNLIVMWLFMLNAAFRGAGDATIAMRVLWLGNAINIVLDPLLIFGLGPFPELGVTGAAVATAIGRGAAVVVQLAVLFGGAGVLRITARNARVSLSLMARVLRLSSSAMLQVFISTASWIGLVRIVASFGPDAVAGYTMAMRVVLFALLPAWGLANAAATMVGQGLGAGKPERAESAVWLAGRMNLYFLGMVGVLFMIAAPLIVQLFGGNAQSAAYAVQALRVISAGFFFYAYGMVLTQSFNGAGDTWTPTLLNLACFWCWEIPLAWLLARGVGLGAPGVFVAVTVAFSTLALISAALFRRGRWKLKTV